MTLTMHRLLMHGGAIAEHACMPVGKLSEDAADASNKLIRQ